MYFLKILLYNNGQDYLKIIKRENQKFEQDI